VHARASPIHLDSAVFAETAERRVEEAIECARTMEQRRGVAEDRRLESAMFRER
jgi:hypothetical protein